MPDRRLPQRTHGPNEHDAHARRQPAHTPRIASWAWDFPWLSKCAAASMMPLAPRLTARRLKWRPESALAPLPSDSSSKARTGKTACDVGCLAPAGMKYEGRQQSREAASRQALLCVALGLPDDLQTYSCFRFVFTSFPFTLS